MVRDVARGPEMELFAVHAHRLVVVAVFCMCIRAHRNKKINYLLEVTFIAVCRIGAETSDSINSVLSGACPAMYSGMS